MTKKIITLFLILNLCICLTVLGASNNTNSSENSTVNSVENTDSSDNEETTSSNEIYSTSYNETEDDTTQDTETEENETISSYTTVSSVPEANLGLNNVLNIILIAFGILMILLGIAILIKLKN